MLSRPAGGHGSRGNSVLAVRLHGEVSPCAKRSSLALMMSTRGSWAEMRYDLRGFRQPAEGARCAGASDRAWDGKQAARLAESRRTSTRRMELAVTVMEEGPDPEPKGGGAAHRLRRCAQFQRTAPHAAEPFVIEHGCLQYARFKASQSAQWHWPPGIRLRWGEVWRQQKKPLYCNRLEGFQFGIFLNFARR